MMRILTSPSKSVREEVNSEVKTEVKPEVNKEEARLKGLELQRKIREKVKEKERQAELERERNRIKQGKEISKARRALEENQKKLDFEFLKKNREKDNLERERLKAKIEADKRARFGEDYNEKQKKVNIKDDFYKIFRQMIKIYRYTDKNLLMNCLKTIGKYLGNIAKKFSEPKFQTIKKDNKVFVKRIANVIGGTNLLKVAGFQEDPSTFQFAGTLEGLQEFLGYLECEVNKLDMT